FAQACLCGSLFSSFNLAPVPFASMVEAVLCGALFLLWNGSDTDLQLVSSQAATVDNRRTKLTGKVCLCFNSLSPNLGSLMANMLHKASFFHAGERS
ncbi:hypothetical protein HID58_018586, partial [Brassica napus]